MGANFLLLGASRPKRSAGPLANCLAYTRRPSDRPPTIAVSLGDYLTTLRAQDEAAAATNAEQSETIE
jgi:hypothetical protein